MNKRIVILFLIFSISLGMVNHVSAYSYPDSFWSINEKYTAALDRNMHTDIIRYGTQIIDLMSNAANGTEKDNILLSRYKAVGAAYASLGDYDRAAEMFGKLYTYATSCGNTDYAKSAKAHVQQYTSEIKLYTDGGTSPYYGAKNEKQNGVLFGACSNGGIRNDLKNESMILTYQEFGQHLIAYNEGIMREAKKSGCAVEFALNCPNEANDIKNIANMTSYLKEISDMFKKYPEVPVYLRFAAEFDIWDKLVDADSFKTAFRTVSQYFKSRNSNVAVVWSPNYASNGTVNIDDYYPGDEYVDWVGMSLYAQRYFLGDKNQTTENEVLFKTGLNSNPIVAARNIIETYGNRKPIMISECGCGHYVHTQNENTSDFALQRLKEYYAYLPMVYPQIKVMAYFDWYVGGERDDVRLSSNTAMKNEFLRFTKGERFIQDSYDNNTGFCYRELYNNAYADSIFPVSCYAHRYGDTLKSVTYTIDGNYAGQSNQIPFTAYIDASRYPGRHTLRAVASFASGKTLTTEYTINIEEGSDISVEISGNEIGFDQPPILYHDRTMVPMRKIFEELGATVSWDNSTQTASGRRGERTVKITVGSNKMYVNSREIMLDTSAIILSDRTLVPVRAVAEGMGCDVDWDGRYSLVSITPKVFRWSNWATELPDDVDDDLYYIEREDEYRYRTRNREYFTLDYKINSGNYVKENITYGNWSSWQDGYISASDNTEVETRTQSSPKKYHFAHYCTGNISDSSDRYKTWDRWWRDECAYHDMGWYDYIIDEAPDGNGGYVLYNSDGSIKRCANTCYRYYIIETAGGDYTQYRSRPIYHKYTYWQWSDWSYWSDWGTDEPYRSWDDEEDMDIESRRVYRYKEKG